MSLPICTYGNPILRKKAVKVKTITAETHELAKEMLETMYKEHGVGLAAEQVGRTEHMYVLDIPPELVGTQNQTAAGSSQGLLSSRRYDLGVRQA